jgi:hypothetical protein
MNEKQYDFLFGLNVPVNRPTDEEIYALRDGLEDYLKQLIGSGYMTTEEAVAYIKFSAQLSSFVPFLIDGFLSSYRNSKKTQ